MPWNLLWALLLIGGACFLWGYWSGYKAGHEDAANTVHLDR